MCVTECLVVFKNRYFLSLTNSKGNLLYFCPNSPWGDIYFRCDNFILFLTFIVSLLVLAMRNPKCRTLCETDLM